jgi:hypothetical protein
MDKREIQELRSLAKSIDNTITDNPFWGSGRENMYLGGYEWALLEEMGHTISSKEMSRNDDAGSAAWIMGFMDCIGDQGYESIVDWFHGRKGFRWR